MIFESRNQGPMTIIFSLNLKILIDNFYFVNKNYFNA